MPQEAPIEFPAQDLSKPFVDPAAPARRREPGAGWYRALIAVLTFALAALLICHMILFLGSAGWTALKGLVLLFYVFTVAWIAFPFACAVVAVWRRLFGKSDSPRRAAAGMRVAILILTYNEPPEPVFGNARAMLRALSEASSLHRYEVFVLSDTTDPALAQREEVTFSTMCNRPPIGVPLYYRRRAQNIERKVGNITDWVRRWGGAYDAMLILDADSIMSVDAIRALTDELACDETLGLVQSAPRIAGARTLFGRMQQFATAAYGPIVTAGMNGWMRDEANYWGHNAILRVKAFAASAGLPPLPGKPPLGGAILSHDFVEAGLLRRAGWGVRLVEPPEGSYEEAPPSVIDYVLRDRRWCQGNLQHLRLVSTPGLHPVSRFHLIHGVGVYLASPFWALFLLFGAAASMEAGLVSGGSSADRTSSWGAGETEHGLNLLAATLLVLLTPKLLALLCLVSSVNAKGFGNRFSLAASALLEILLMAIVAPILMVQQSIAVGRVCLGVDGGWCVQRRGESNLHWGVYFRFHAVETALGAALIAALLAGLLVVWFWPIALSLFLAAPISRLCSTAMTRRRNGRSLFATPEEVRCPAILQLAREEQLALRCGISAALTRESPRRRVGVQIGESAVAALSDVVDASAWLGNERLGLSDHPTQVSTPRSHVGCLRPQEDR